MPWGEVFLVVRDEDLVEVDADAGVARKIKA